MFALIVLMLVLIVLIVIGLLAAYGGKPYDDHDDDVG